MALKVQKLAVSRAVVPAEDLWGDVVAVPPGFPRDQETAHRTFAALRPPEIKAGLPGPARVWAMSLLSRSSKYISRAGWYGFEARFTLVKMENGKEVA